jgi:hypothetical protein
MKANVVRLLLLAVVVTAALWSPAYSYALPLCPTAFCWDLQTQCIAEGGNHDYFGWVRETGSFCQDDIGDIYQFDYVDCCKLPGCNPLVWRAYCRQ